MLNNKTDIIRTNGGDYINITSGNRLIARLAEASADTAYSFGICFGSQVDKKTADEMQGTYWVSSQVNVDKIDNEDVQIVRL